MNELKLLNLLKNNANATITELSEVLGEPFDVVAKTKTKLESNKVICGYHTLINWDKTNFEYCMAIIEVGAKPKRDVGYDEIAKSLVEFDEISTVLLVSGKSEFIVVIEGKTMREIADFVGQKLAPIEGVEHTITCFVLQAYKKDGISLLKNEKSERLIVTP
ncbi:MAG: Lrp/AsnC family transcriptional regulator [Anaerorhabdus sp.]